MFRARFLLRCLRVLVACLALGIVAAPASAALARGDGIACIARSVRRTEANRTPVVGRPAGAHDAARAAVAANARSNRIAAPRRVARPSARARDVVVRHRIYLRHAALLC